MIQGIQTSIVRSFSQADFDSFARLSGDHNPIHTDPAFSARTRFGRPVAHGLLLCGVLRGLIDKVVPGGRLTDFMNKAEHFIAVVNARVTDHDGKELTSGAFLNLNLHKIEVIMPVDKAVL